MARAPATRGVRGSMATLLLLLAVATAARVGDIARRDQGDAFTVLGTCGASQCAEHGAGARGDCACACPQRAPLFREDRELCVDDLPECSLATFGTGVGVQKIPFVYLPLKGQIIHPSREITFQNVKTPICAVSGAQFLTRKGFLDLRNTIDADVPFSLFRDEGRTFLQWSGEDEMRVRMSGRVMVVRLLCRDVSAPPPPAAPAAPLDLRGVFTPCVAFRVQGTPPRLNSNVTEVQFTPNAQTSEASSTSGLSVTEYVAIGISSLLLGLIYVASVFLYLHIRKRRKAASEEGTTRRLKGIKKKDGTAITERDIIRINNERVPSLPPSMQDEGIVKKNPLLSINRQFLDSKSSFPSDSGSNMSDSEDFANSSVRSEENMVNNLTSAVIHHREFKLHHESSETNHRDESSIERLPDEHVSIVETTDDREIARPVGTTRRKLYFNPAYFEPHLMAEPPPAALEFLTKIREVIAIAKHKMIAKRFQPVLNQIPEEETYPSNRNSIDYYQGLGSQRSGSIVSLKRENSRKRSVNCVGCPGCKSDTNADVQNYLKYDMPACSNCISNKGDKQNSIQKWLENIPTVKQQTFYNDFMPNVNQNGLVNSLLSLPTESKCKIKKQNSFSGSNSMYFSDNLSKPKKTSTMSVRSEPPLRNYNIPLPEFEHSEYQPNNYSSHCQTVSKTDAIRPINLPDYRAHSLRGLSNLRMNKFITNKNALPDMVNEAIALEHGSKAYNHSSSDEERFSKVPNTSNIYSRLQSESPLGNDYETDSLERTSNKKGVTTPTDYPEMPSSQASPSLSNALPLEEELTMRNAVYKHSSSNSNTPSPQRDIFIDQNHYETIGRKNIEPEIKDTKTDSKINNYSLVSEVYVNNNFGSPPSSPSGSDSSIGNRKLVEKLNTEALPGCLTIEVKDSPENYIKIHESDGFEPDTLDRKHPKHKEAVDNIQFSRKDLIKNLNNDENHPKQRILLRSSGTFKKTNEKVEYATKFNSLRNDFELRKNTCERPKLSPNTFSSGSKSLDITTDDTWEDVEEWVTEEGRILTLELRHSKRQRQCTPPTIKQLKSLARPDVLPPLPPADENSIYEQPNYPPRRVENNKIPIQNHTKNLNGRSLSPRKSTKNIIESQGKKSAIRDPKCGPSCSPMRASVESQSSEYEIVHPTDAHDAAAHPVDFCRNSGRIPTAASLRGNEINTNTFVKGLKTEQQPRRFKRRKGSTIEDSGYLSSDSTSSRKVQRKLVIAKIVSCSESDDTENEARSESGAESIETHSVYFGSFRKLQTVENNGFNGLKSVRDSCKKKRQSTDNL